MVDQYQGIPVFETDEMTGNTSIWIVSFGPPVDLRYSRARMWRKRLTDAFAVMRGRKSAFTPDEISDMIGDDG